MEEKLKERKGKQERYYNKGTKELAGLRPGETVRMKPLPIDGNKLWKKAINGSQTGRPRSYQVDSQGSVYRRNRRYLLKTKESQQLMPEPEMSSPAKEIQSKKPVSALLLLKKLEPFCPRPLK